MWDYIVDYANRIWSSTLPNRLVWALAVGIVFETLIWLSARAIRRALHPVLQRDNYLDATERVHRRRILLTLPLQLSNGLLTAVAILIILRYLGFATSVELIPLTIALLAVAALIAWPTLRDCIAGYYLLLDDLFSVGDRVTIGEHTGTVTAVGLRFTRLQLQDGREISIANGEIRTVVNLTRVRDAQRKAQGG